MGQLAEYKGRGALRLLIISSDRTDTHGGACNLGDALLTDALLDAICAAGHQAQAYDFGASERRTSDGRRINGGRGMDLLRAISDADGVVIGGGTMLQDDRKDRFFSGLPRLCATVSAAAAALGRPVAFYGVGLDNVERPVPRRLIGFATRRARVWLREEASCERYVSSYGREAVLGADAALLLETARRPTLGSAGPLTLALNRSDAKRLRIEEVRAWRQRFADVRFLAMDQQEDDSDWLALPEEVREHFGGPGPAVLGWKEAADVIAESGVVVASRMHALYLSMMLGVPAVAIGSLDKVTAFADEFGLAWLASPSDYRGDVPPPVSEALLNEARHRATWSLEQMLTWFERQALC